MMNWATPVGLVGGVGLTHLRVYEQRPAPDGKMSGSAHVHGVTDEAYYVLAGAGAVELLDVERGYRSVSLARGSYVHFTAGTLHRIVSTGGLEVLAIMGNAGLPERGDARIYFGRAVDEEPGAYERLDALSRHAGLEGALERRDASVRALMDLVGLWERDRAAFARELQRFIDLHARVMAERRAELAEAIEEGPGRWSRLALDRLAALPAPVGAPMSAAAAHGGGGTAYGMCGILNPVHCLDRV